jgi:hypothetical protein
MKYLLEHIIRIYPIQFMLHTFSTCLASNSREPPINNHVNNFNTIWSLETNKNGAKPKSHTSRINN